MYRPVAVILAGCSFVVLSGTAQAGPRDDILAGLEAEARAGSPAFAGFDAGRGEALFRDRHEGGKPETPACTSCHDPDPAKVGMTRAGKAIAPMAVSVQADRYTDPAKVAKWFRRNCNSVLGRDCTAVEQGDFLTFMSSQ